MAKDIVVRLIADAKAFVKGTKDAEKATEGLTKRQQEAAKLSSGLGEKLSDLRGELSGKFGPAAEVADGALEKVTARFAEMPVAAQAAVAGVAAVGAGLVAMTAQGLARLQELTAQVRQFRDVSGLSWEAASRLNAVFADYGVEAEDAVDATKTLAEEITLAPEKFERFGVAIRRTKDGAVDVEGTLLNLADRFDQIQDPSERAAMGAEIFEDTWLKIAPVLEQGGAKLRKLTSEVDDSRIITEETAQQQLELEKSTRELRKQYEELQLTLAKSALPEIVRDLGTVVDTVDAASDAFESLSNAVDKIPGGDKVRKALEVGTNPLAQIREARDQLERVKKAFRDAEPAAADMAKATDYSAKAQAEHAEELAVVEARLRDYVSAQNAAAGAMDESRRAADRLRTEQKKLEDQVKSLYDATLSSIDTEHRWQQQQETTADSIRDMSWRQAEATEAKRLYGAESTLAQNAEEAYRRQVDETKGSVLDAARATADNARAQAEANGTTLTAQQYNAIYKDELIRLRDTAGDPALAGALDRYIAKLAETETKARDAAAQIAEMSRQAAIQANATQGQGMGIITSAAQAERLAGQRASGGPVAAGKSYLVGEQGPEILTMGSQPGRVIPNGALAGGGGPVIFMEVHGVIAPDLNQFAAQAAPALHEALRRLQGARS